MVENHLLGFLTDLRYWVNIQAQIAFFTEASVKLLLTSSLISDSERKAEGCQLLRYVFSDVSWSPQLSLVVPFSCH